MTDSSTFEILASGGTLIGSREITGKAADPIRKDHAGSNKIAWWGDDNLYPQLLNAWIEKHPILSSKFPLAANMISSGGVAYGMEEESGFVKKFDQKVQDFHKQIKITNYLNDLPVEILKYQSGYVEFILSKDRKKIVNIVAQETTFARVSRLDLKELQGKPQICYLNANWDLGANEDDEYCIKRTLLDPYNDPIAQMREGSEFAYIYPIKGASSGRVYYPEPWWTSAIKSKWLEYSLAIPEAKLAKINNAMMVMYHIEVPREYWKDAYPDWDEKPELKKDRKKEKQLEWTNALTDKKNWGKVLMTGYRQLENEKVSTHHILFKVLENPFKATELIEDSFEANSQIYQALGIDATLFGTIPGKQMGAGSGSDKEWAWILSMINTKPLQDLILSPLALAYEYNGFNYTPVMKNYLLAEAYMLKARGDKKDPNPQDPNK